jgi:copper chaperone CopZ
MKTITIPIENLKCQGCAATIRKEVSRIKGIKSVSVNLETAGVEISYEGDESVPAACKSKLRRLGYPETGSNSTLSKAKSYVSCAIGRISDTP